MQKRNHKLGFTLIELLLVISIIVILASLILVSVSKARAKGRDSKRIANISTIQLALEMYHDSNNKYPTALTSGWVSADSFAGDLTNYLSPIPKDPINKTNYTYQILGNIASPAATGYSISALMEDPDNVPEGDELGAKCYQITGGVKFPITAPSYCN